MMQTPLNGRFRIPDLAPGPYRITAGARSPYVCDPVIVDAGRKDLVLRPRLGGTIEGRVVGIEPKDLPFGVVAFGKNSYYAATDEKGRFVIEGLPDGRYTVRTNRYGWFPDPVLDGIEAGTKGLRLSAIRAVSIRGKIVTKDGSPVGQCSISTGEGTVRQDKTGGGFEIHGLRPGHEYTIRVHARGGSVLREVRAPASGVVIAIE